MSTEKFTDAQRIEWLAEQFKTCTVYMSGQHPYAPNSHKLRNLCGPTFRAALDAAMEANGWSPTAGQMTKPNLGCAFNCEWPTKCCALDAALPKGEQI